jgi:thienamycin biosynthesis protein ThnO
MGTAAESLEVTAPAVGLTARQSTEALVPALVGSRHHVSDRPRPLIDCAGGILARVAVAPRLVQRQMVRVAEAAGPRLAAVPEADWWAIFATAAQSVRARIAAPAAHARPYAELVSRATGLPRTRVERAALTLADDCARMRAIVAAQAPAGTAVPYRTGGGGWVWAPAGRHVAVRVPDNFPTIGIQWLQALALRRPVLLSTAPRDPFTALLLADALYGAGLPEGAISICHGDAPALWSLADQVLWPGDQDAAPGGQDRKSTRLNSSHNR